MRAILFASLVAATPALAQVAPAPPPQPPTLEDWQAAFSAAQNQRNAAQTAQIDAEVHAARAEREIVVLKRRIEELEKAAAKK